jgi:drug/metabolite transporter (DMT)-like permease
LHPISVGLVLLSAVAHVGWNYQVKRSPAPAIYTWWLMVAGVVLFAPLAVWLSWPLFVPPAGWYCVAGTGLLYAAYFTLIARSYDRDDLSRAYPIARGVAPAATVALGLLFQREHPTLAGWLGIAGICLGVFTLVAAPLRGAQAALPLAGILAAVGTGLCTSGYSVVDKEGVKHVNPALYIVLTFTAGALAQGALLWRGRGWPVFRAEARRGGASILLSGALSLGGYLLILEVLRQEPVSYVVPLRSVSVLLSVFVGSRWLGEAGGMLRAVSAALILLGITAITLGG